MRIDIIGLPATGKSTLAEAISKKFSIPYIHLDRYWFETAAHKTSKGSPEREKAQEEIKSRVEPLVNQENWVSEGEHFWIQPLIAPRATQIVFVDIPLWNRLLNHAKRLFRRRARHQELSVWDDLVFFWEIIKRIYTKREKSQNNYFVFVL